MIKAGFPKVLIQTWRRWWRPLAWTGATALLIASVVWAILLYQILPRIDEWRDALSQQATRALGVTVKIGRVRGHPERGWPVLTLSEIQLFDERGQVALRLPEVTARISPASLWPTAIWRQEWQLDRLVLVRPELDVRRDAQGRVFVAGLRVDSPGPGSDDASAADWVLSQSLIKIEQGSVRWTDEMLANAPVALQQVNLALRNRPGLGRRWHELQLEATPPAEFGQRFVIKASMAQPLWQVRGVLIPEGASVPWWRQLLGSAPRPSQWETWSGSVLADMPWVDVQKLKQHVVLPIDIDGGRGRVKAELAVFKGHAQGLGLEANVQDVSVRLAKDLAPLAFKRVAGRVDFSHEPEVTSIQYKNLAFETAEGLVWPSSSAKLQWQHTPWPSQGLGESWGKVTKGGELLAERLDLALLAQLADRLPLSSKWRATLRDLAPQGVGDKLQWRWEGSLDAPKRYRASGRFARLGWASSSEAGSLGLAHANVSFDADEGGGRAQLGIDQGWVDFPGVFEEPRVPFNSLQSVVSWEIKPAKKAGASPDIDVRVKQATFANPDAQGELQAHWMTGGRQGATGVARYPGTLVMDGTLFKAQANRVWRYMPSALTTSAREYLRDALQQGLATNVTFSVDGDLNDFPFKNDVGGRFRVKVPVQQVSLDYAPSARKPGDPYWPIFVDLKGKLLFEGQRMRIDDAQGRLGTLGTGRFTLRHVEGLIDNLGQDNPHLVIKGQGEGALDDVLKYLSTSPVGALTGSILTMAQGGGDSAMQLALDIPLDHAEHTTLKGRVLLKDADRASLRLAPGLPLFESVVGDISFTESILTVNARTKVWGQDVVIDGRRDANGAPRFVARGVMSAEGLRQANEWPLLSRLATRMSGQSPFMVTVALPKPGSEHGAPGQPVIEVTSSLQGMAASLPAPLNKAADSVWPLKVSYQADDAQGQTDALMVEVGNPQASGLTEGAPWLKADYRRDVSGPQAKVLRGVASLIQAGQGRAVGVPLLPPKGVTVQVNVPLVDIDAWQSLGKALQGNGEGAGAGSGGYVPDSLTIKTASVQYQQRTLKDVSATLAHPMPGVWRALIDSQQVAGQIEWLPDLSPAGQAAGRIVARLSRLSIPAADAQALEDQAAEQILSMDSTTKSVPALDIVIDQFDWRGLSLGKLEIEAMNRLVPSAGFVPVPEWRLTKLKLASPEAQLNASGAWSAASVQPGSRRFGGAPRSRPRSSFDFTLDLQNLGDTLSRLGLPKTIRGGNGKVTGQVSWQGSPLEPDAATMSGDMAVAINEGQFLRVDPGIAKLFGVLSLQSLPRRLTLDFRDVFQQGFAFDAIDGNIKITQGVADTRNLRMRGVQAVVLMEGQADLIKETQNLHVYVVPDVNAVGASLAYAAINPVVGLGTFLAQVLFRKQVSEASTQEFMVTGNWADPQVERMHTKTPVPAAASAPSQPIALPRATEGGR